MTGDDTINPGHLAFPLAKQIWPTLLANQIVSVQPMTAPTNSVFYMNYAFPDTIEGEAALKNIEKDFDSMSPDEQVEILMKKMGY
jgi:hypothetical protein